MDMNIKQRLEQNIIELKDTRPDESLRRAKIIVEIEMDLEKLFEKLEKV